MVPLVEERHLERDELELTEGQVRVVDLVELARLDNEEDEGAGEVKVTFLTFGGSI